MKFKDLFEEVLERGDENQGENKFKITWRYYPDPTYPVITRYFSSREKALEVFKNSTYNRPKLYELVNGKWKLIDKKGGE
jgi:hypothetical protein